MFKECIFAIAPPFFYEIKKLRLFTVVSISVKTKKYNCSENSYYQKHKITFFVDMYSIQGFSPLHPKTFYIVQYHF